MIMYTMSCNHFVHKVLNSDNNYTDNQQIKINSDNQIIVDHSCIILTQVKFHKCIYDVWTQTLGNK